jgi:hypothetical protein
MQSVLLQQIASGNEPASSWGPAQWATVIGACIAVLGVAATILTASARSRREQRATLYAQALGSVADYVEGPYRVRRKDGTAEHRNAITASLSDVKSSIDHNRALLRLHGRREVADAFEDYALAAAVEAGAQMHAAWLEPAIQSDAEVNLEVAYDRTFSDRYKAQVVAVMQADLDRHTWKGPFAIPRYRRVASARLPDPRNRARQVSGDTDAGK